MSQRPPGRAPIGLVVISRWYTCHERPALDGDLVSVAAGSDAYQTQSEPDGRVLTWRHWRFSIFLVVLQKPTNQSILLWYLSSQRIVRQA